MSLYWPFLTLSRFGPKLVGMSMMVTGLRGFLTNLRQRMVDMVQVPKNYLAGEFGKGSRVELV
jgi:hypothetical protein